MLDSEAMAGKHGNYPRVTKEEILAKLGLDDDSVTPRQIDAALRLTGFRELAKKRWAKLDKAERSKIMRAVAASKPGVDKERCPCGIMTLARAIKRRHVLPVDDSLTVDWECRPGVGL